MGSAGQWRTARPARYLLSTRRSLQVQSVLVANRFIADCSLTRWARSLAAELRPWLSVKTRSRILPALVLITTAGTACSGAAPPPAADTTHPESVAVSPPFRREHSAIARTPPPPPAGEPSRVGKFRDFLLRGSTRVLEGAPDTLRLEVVVTNTGSVPREFHWGTCSPVWAYRAGDVLDQPAWYSPRRRSWPHGVPTVCGGSIMFLGLNPGASTLPGRISWGYPVIEILGDSLPAGRYRFVTELQVGETGWDPLTSVTLDLGEVYLSR